MTGETDIEDSRTYAFILNDIDDMRHQRSRLPGKGAAWFQNNLQPGVALVEALHQTDEPFYVVVLTRHQMSAAEIDPFELGEPFGELLLDMGQRPLKHICPTLAMTMTMKTADILRQRLRQFVGRYPKTGAWSTRIIEQRAHL